MNRQTRIFAPHNPPFNNDNWAETILGLVVRPVYYNPNLNWCWFSRYNCPASMDSTDCNIKVIPEITYMHQQSKHFRSLRVRYSIKDEFCEDFENQLRILIENSGCMISDFRNYDFVGDLGSNRHIGGERSQERRETRANHVANLYKAICSLTLDTLVGPDENGIFSQEYNDCDQIPFNSSFETPHHLFCNITQVPLRVLISESGIGTDALPPPGQIQGAAKVIF